MIDSQAKLPEISYDWTSFDSFHQPLHSFNEHMAKVIHGSWSDSDPSLLNRVFSIALSPIIYPLCGLSALIGIVCHALGMTFVDESQMFHFLHSNADMKSLKEIINLGIIKNEDIVSQLTHIAHRCLEGQFQIAKLLIEQIDTSEVLTEYFWRNMGKNSFMIEVNIESNATQKFKENCEEIRLLNDKRLLEWMLTPKNLISWSEKSSTLAEEIERKEQRT